MRLASYLYVNERLTIRVDEDAEGAGSTIAARISDSDRGKPPAIGSLDTTVSATTGSPLAYTIVFTPTTLAAALAAYIGQRVYLHVWSTVNEWYEVYPLVVTDRDPDTLAPPLS